jgi:hypothetical protein
MNTYLNKTPDTISSQGSHRVNNKRGEGHFAIQLADNRTAVPPQSDQPSQQTVQRHTQQPIQRHISWAGGAGQFQLDGLRPGWMDGMGGVAVGPGQSRNHIIDFENIQNDLANILNALVAANTLVNQNRLINFTNAIIPTAGGARVNMINLRNTLMASITAGTVGNYNTEARALLSQLNSSPDNVRVGNAAINASIGQNIDADFNPGAVAFAGGMVSTTAVPGGVVVPAQPVLTLTPASNNQVYQYQMVTQQAISFVINPLNNRQLSSVTGPTVGTVAPAPPHPVLVTDPAGVGMPLLYT